MNKDIILEKLRTTKELDRDSKLATIKEWGRQAGDWGAAARDMLTDRCGVRMILALCASWWEPLASTLSIFLAWSLRFAGVICSRKDVRGCAGGLCVLLALWAVYGACARVAVFASLRHCYDMYENAAFQTLGPKLPQSSAYMDAHAPLKHALWLSCIHNLRPRASLVKSALNQALRLTFTYNLRSTGQR